MALLSPSDFQYKNLLCSEPFSAPLCWAATPHISEFALEMNAITTTRTSIKRGWGEEYKASISFVDKTIILMQMKYKDTCLHHSFIKNSALMTARD